MSNQLAGDAVSRCPLQHVVTLRLVTFTTARDKEKEPETYADDWTPVILIQLSDANRIFNRYGILIQQGHREDIPELNDPQLARIRSSEFCQIYDRRRANR